MRTVTGAALLAALLFVPSTPALPTAACTVDRATGTTIAATPFRQKSSVLRKRNTRPPL